MTGLTNQRGVSLMLLVLAITVFAGVAVGVVTLLRTRHESYPYQVQSYQAYALAHAGIEFGIRYAKDNADDFLVNPAKYLPPPGKEFSYGNGKFVLTYNQGTYNQGTWDCRDKLTSRGTCGTATRGVELLNFSLFLRQNANNLYVTRVIPPSCYGCPDPPPFGSCSICGIDNDKDYPYLGHRIEVEFCDPGLFLPGAMGQASMVVKDSIRIAATKDQLNNSVKLLRLGFLGVDGSGNETYNWVWDAACRTDVPPGGQYKDYFVELDPVNPVPLQWNVNQVLPIAADLTCRPRSPSDPSTDPYYPLKSNPPPVPYLSFDNNRDCTVWGAAVARSHATCYATNSMVDPWALPLKDPPLAPLTIGDAYLWSGRRQALVIETTYNFVPPVTFYVSFSHRPWPNVPGTEKLNVFRFTVQ
jgi:hypothetical protein